MDNKHTNIEMARLTERVKELSNEGKLQEAIAAAQELIKVRKKVLEGNN